MRSTLEQKLETVLAGLKEVKLQLRTLANGHVSGRVVSKDFDGLDFENRRKRLRQLIDKAVEQNVITKSDALSISTLLTYTPDEWSVASAESATLMGE